MTTATGMDVANSSMLPELQQQLLEAIEAMRKDLHAIKQAVQGDEQIGLKGLVHRVDQAEEKLRRLDMRMMAVGGGAAVVIWIAEHMIFK